MKKAYFISDLHLGAAYLKDKRATEQRVVRFLDTIAGDAAELYLLGDILDYWYEYRHVVPQGHVRFLGKLAQLADAGVRITWFTGNHDVWLFHYLEREIGLTVLRGHTQLSIMGHEFLLSHGDDVGHPALLYRITRWCFYNPVCQWLYAAVHPRWTYPLATTWSSSNRTSRHDEQVRAAQERCAQDLTAFSRDYAAAHPQVEHFVYGHLHLARHSELGEGRTVTFLGDWISQFTYATFDGQVMQLHHFHPERQE